MGRRLVGRSPGVVLSPEGRAQAQRLARRLATAPPAALYASPMERAQETAAALAEATGLTVRTHTAFDEMAVGEWRGAAFEELDQDPRWRRHNAFRSGGGAPGGELAIAVQARVVSGLLELEDAHRGERVAVVTHAAVLRSAITWMVGMPLDLLLRLEVSPAGVTTFELGDGGPRLLSMNVTAHLEG